MPEATKEQLQGRRNQLEKVIANKVAAIEAIEAGIEDLRKTRSETVEISERKRLAKEINEDLVRRKALKADIEAREARLEKVSKRIRKLVREARSSFKPKIIVLDLTFKPMTSQSNLIGTTGHYTAGPHDDDLEEALRLWRSYHQSHINLGWAGLGYQIGFTSDGVIVLLRPFTAVGSHTYLNNTGRIGVSVHGTTGDTWTKAQTRAYNYWLNKGHTSAFPASHRTSRPPKELQRKVHKDFNATSCPGNYEHGYRTI